MTARSRGSRSCVQGGERIARAILANATFALVALSLPGEQVALPRCSRSHVARMRVDREHACPGSVISRMPLAQRVRLWHCLLLGFVLCGWLVWYLHAVSASFHGEVDTVRLVLASPVRLSHPLPVYFFLAVALVVWAASRSLAAVLVVQVGVPLAAAAWAAWLFHTAEGIGRFLIHAVLGELAIAVLWFVLVALACAAVGAWRRQRGASDTWTEGTPRSDA